MILAKKIIFLRRYKSFNKLKMSLPSDVILKILKMVTPECFLKCKLVNKEFNKIVRYIIAKHPNLIPKFKITYFIIDFCQDTIKITLVSRYRLYRTEKLSSCIYCNEYSTLIHKPELGNKCPHCILLPSKCEDCLRDRYRFKNFCNHCENKSSSNNSNCLYCGTLCVRNFCTHCKESRNPNEGRCSCSSILKFNYCKSCKKENFGQPSSIYYSCSICNNDEILNSFCVQCDKNFYPTTDCPVCRNPSIIKLYCPNGCENSLKQIPYVGTIEIPFCNQAFHIGDDIAKNVFIHLKIDEVNINIKNMKKCYQDYYMNIFKLFHTHPKDYCFYGLGPSNCKNNVFYNFMNQLFIDIPEFKNISMNLYQISDPIKTKLSKILKKHSKKKIVDDCINGDIMCFYFGKRCYSLDF